MKVDYLGDIEKIVVKQQKNVERIMKRLSFLEYLSSEENPAGIEGFSQSLQPKTPRFLLSQSTHTFSEMLEELLHNQENSFQVPPLDTENDLDDIIAAYGRFHEKKRF